MAPRASCLPLSSGRGIVRVTKSGGGVLGYIRKTFDGQNSYTFGPETEALIVQLSSTQDNAGWIEFTAVNGPDPSHPFVGAVGGSGGYNFNPGQLGCVPLFFVRKPLSHRNVHADTRTLPELDTVSLNS